MGFSLTLYIISIFNLDYLQIVQPAKRARSGDRRGLPLRPEHDAGDPGRVFAQPPGAGTGLPRYRTKTNRG